jgi:hypothetical protein
MIMPVTLPAKEILRKKSAAFSARGEILIQWEASWRNRAIQRMKQMLGEWQKKLREIDPSVYLVIRAHLLLEEQINLYLEKKLPNPEFVDGLRFREKVQLVRALSKDGKKEEELWQVIALLNTLRNQSAHRPHEKSGPVRMDTLMKILDLMAKSMLNAKWAKELKEHYKADSKKSPSPELIRLAFSYAQESLAKMTERENIAWIT